MHNRNYQRVGLDFGQTVSDLREGRLAASFRRSGIWKTDPIRCTRSWRVCVEICVWNPVNCLCVKFRNYSTPSTPATESHCSKNNFGQFNCDHQTMLVFNLLIWILHNKILARIYPKLKGAAREDGRVVYHAISPWLIPCEILYGFHDQSVA